MRFRVEDGKRSVSGAFSTKVKEVRDLHPALSCILNGWRSVELLELSPAIGEWCESLPEDPGGKPAFCGGKALKTLDSLQSAVELFVVAFDEVRRAGAVDVQESPGFDVGGELLAAPENVLHRCNLHGIVLMAGRTPADACLQTFLAQDGDVEDVFLDICKESSVRFLAPRLERPPDVLEEMDVADLGDTAGKDVQGCHADGIVLIAGDAAKHISGVLELREELEHGLEVLTEREKTDGNIMRFVVNAVDQGDLLRVTLHRHVLPVDHQRTSEALGIAVPFGDLVVVREP